MAERAEDPDTRDPSGPVFELARALENAMGELEILTELAEIFCDASGGFLQQIADGIERRDGMEVQRAAHTLKGSLSPFCADDAYRAALRMEHLGQDNDFRGAEEALPDLEREIERLNAALGKLLVD